MNTKEIVDAVTMYIEDDDAKYAVLIDGEWGSGKTYLYNNYLVDAINSIEIGKDEHKSNVYISLYGISTIESLSKQLFTNFLALKGERIKSIAGIIGVIGNALTFSVGPISTDVGGVIDVFKSNIKIENLVICFDDLERCTIPINELFGFTNNLVEHCNCKVIILSDENNIGKIYANSNVEAKYLSVLTGNRKVVENNKNPKNKNQNHGASNSTVSDEITVDELKKLNEILFSENYLYKDIKEKVIGKTMFYYPSLKEVIIEIIEGNSKSEGIVGKGDYRVFLLERLENIVKAFDETQTHNLRIIKTWVGSFMQIYSLTTKYYKDSKYYKDILDEFIRYSIWVASSFKKNEKIFNSEHYVNQDYVYYEENEYTSILRYSFIDTWIRRDVWNDNDFSLACNSIIKRREREKINNPIKLSSSGTAFIELHEWRYMEDGNVQKTADKLIEELKNDSYAYYDYSNILTLFIYLQSQSLYKGELSNIQQIMIDNIRKDQNVQEEDEFPKTFESKADKEKYDELYRPIMKEREDRNKELGISSRDEADFYRNASTFYDDCCIREEYYLLHKSFMEYLDFDKLLPLIDRSDNRGIYRIHNAFGKVYCMGNVREFYENDLNDIERLIAEITVMASNEMCGKTRKIALDYFKSFLQREAELLGATDISQNA